MQTIFWCSRLDDSSIDVSVIAGIGDLLSAHCLIALRKPCHMEQKSGFSICSASRVISELHGTKWTQESEGESENGAAGAPFWNGAVGRASLKKSVNLEFCAGGHVIERTGALSQQSDRVSAGCSGQMQVSVSPKPSW